MNRRHAELMGAGTGREALLELVRRDEVGLAMPEADLVACLAHELTSAAEARAELYLRVAAEAAGGTGRRRRRRGGEGGALVHCVRLKEFDGLGRVVRVRRLPNPSRRGGAAPRAPCARRGPNPLAPAGVQRQRTCAQAASGTDRAGAAGGGGGVGGGQVSLLSRAITAEEYNAAAARAPGDCPLLATSAPAVRCVGAPRGGADARGDAG